MRRSSVPSPFPSLRPLLAITSCVALGAFATGLPAAEPVRVPSFAFASRAVVAPADPASRGAAIERGRDGRLVVWAPGGETRILVDGAAPQSPVDVMDPDVSFAGDKIVFAGFDPADDAWRIFEVNADGSGLHKVTLSDRESDAARYGAAWARLAAYDDVDPCYLPDGRICFVSTRYPGIAPDGRVRATNLYVVAPDGSGLHRITTERFGADTPAVDPASGRIVYSRWWRTAQAIDQNTGSVPDPIPPGSPGYGNVDPGSGQGTVSPVVLRGVDPGQFPGVNSWFLASVGPDGTGLRMHTGFRIDREQTQAYKPSFLPGGDVIALFIPRTPVLGAPGKNGLRRYTAGPGRPAALGGPQTFGQDLIPVPVDAAGQPAPPMPFPSALVYASAAALPDGTVLASASLDGSSYSIWVQDGASSPPQLVFRESEPGRSALDPAPLVRRSRPPVAPDGGLARMRDDAPATVDQARREGGTFTFLCENIFSNGPLDMAIANAPPAGKRLAIEFYMVPQRTGAAAADPPILIESKEIGPDGKVEAELPGGVPLFELLRRPDQTIGLGRDGQIFHVGGMNFGEAAQKARCVGCHAGHSMMELPADPSWTNLAPSALVTDGSPLVPGQGVGQAGPADPAAGGAKPPFFISQPQALVDRRTDPGLGEWAAVEPKEEQVIQLRWSVPISARELVVYGAAERPADAGRDGARIFPVPVTRAFTARTFLGEEPREEINVRQDVVPAGVRVTLDPSRELDRLTLSIRRADVADPTGAFAGPVLAEVEVIAKPSATATAPAIAFVRGDANCDGVVNLTDAIAALAGLFQGQALCCGAAADSNGDDRLSITDPVALLLNLFQGADPLPPPTRPCDRTPEGALVCDQESCS